MAIALEVSGCDYSYNADSSLVTAGSYYVFLDNPAWVVPVELFGVVNGAFFFYPQANQGVTVVNVEERAVSGGGLIDSGTITLTINSCVTEYTPRCCDNVYNIAWLDPNSGWKNYIFTGKATTGVEQDKGLDYKDENLVLKWSEVQDVYDSIIVGTGAIPKTHIDYTKTLRYAIQAFQYDESTGTWSIPIVIKRESFTMYKRGQHFYEWTLEFKYAQELIVQTQ